MDVVVTDCTGFHFPECGILPDINIKHVLHNRMCRWQGTSSLTYEGSLAKCFGIAFNGIEVA